MHTLLIYIEKHRGGDMDVAEITGSIALGLLGALFAFLIGGVLCGMLRGAKRTTVRIVTLVVCFSLALLFAPVMANMLYSMQIKLPNGLTLKEWIVDLVGGNNVGEIAIRTMPEAADFVFNLPLVILNFVSFFLLLLAFRGISFIFYKIISGHVVPKTDDLGEKVQHSKLYGALVGAAQGLVIFMFFFVPVNGLVFALNQMDSYRPALAEVNLYEKGWGDAITDSMVDVNKAIHDVNSGMQKSAYGVITKFSGVQAVSSVAFDYLCSVDAGGKKVNLKKDVVAASKLSRDVAALYKRFDGMSGVVELTQITDAEYKEIKSVIKRVFDIDLIRVLLNADFSGFISELDVLEKATFVPGGDKIVVGESGESVTIQAEYNQAIYTALSRLNANFVRDDLLKIVDIVQLIFSDHRVGVSDVYNLYKSLDSLVYAVNNKIDVEAAFETMYQSLTAVPVSFGGIDLAHKVFGEIANLNIFKKLLVDSENTNLHSILISQFVGVSRQDAEITDFDSLMNGVAEILQEICFIGPTAVKLYENAENFDVMISTLIDSGSVVSVGRILEKLTNPGEMGTDKVLRKILLDGINGMNTSSTSGVGVGTFINPVKSQLEKSDEPIAWADTLDVLCKLFGEFMELKNLTSVDFESVDIEDLINSDIISIALDNPIVQEIIADVVGEYLVDILEETDVEAAVESYIGSLDPDADAELIELIRKLYGFLT